MGRQGNIGDVTRVADSADVTIGELCAVLRDAGDLPVIFHYDGHEVQPGYHVTEVKAGTFSALDCGGNPEAWAEIFIQLWDVNEDRGHMPAARFVAIIAKVIAHVALDMDAKLTFEVSDGIRPMQLFRASVPIIAATAVHVRLSARPASCKPRDRWLEVQKASCCGGGKSAC